MIITAPEWLAGAGSIALVEIAGSGITTLGLEAGAEATARQVASISRTAAQAGRKGVERALRSFEKLLAQHEADLAKYKAAGGYTSSVESEISNFKGLIRAPQDWLSKNP